MHGHCGPASINVAELAMGAALSYRNESEPLEQRNHLMRLQNRRCGQD
jgi:hypothetical protein